MTEQATMSKTETKAPAAEAKAPAKGVQPWAPLDSLRREVDRLFDDFRTTGWPSPLRWPAAFESALPRMEAWALAPAMDIVEKENAYEVSAELPGMAEADVEVKLVNGVLSIKGEKREEKETREKERYLSERRYGAFQRTVRVPEDVDADKIEAQFARGVLTVTLPKAPQAAKNEKKIAVKAG